MDYVVFGIGMGASLVLLGLAGRAIGPSLRYRRSSDTGGVLKAEELVARIAWSRFCGSLGAAVAIGGVFLLIVTGLVMLLRVGDTAATISVGLSLVAVLVLMVFWTWSFVDRFGLFGILADRPRKSKTLRTVEPVAEETPAEPTSESAPVVTVEAAPTPAESPSPAQPIESRPVPSPPKRKFQPWSTPAEPSSPPTEAAAPVAELTVADPSRSEVVNPSDAAALERILSEPDPVANLAADGDPEPDGAEEQSSEDDAPPPEGETPESDPVVETEVAAPIPAAPWNRRKHQRH